MGEAVKAPTARIPVLDETRWNLNGPAKEPIARRRPMIGKAVCGAQGGAGPTPGDGEPVGHVAAVGGC